MKKTIRDGRACGLLAAGFVVASAGCGSGESANETVPEAASDVASMPEAAPHDAGVGESDSSSELEAGDAMPDSTMSTEGGFDAAPDVASDVAADDTRSTGPIADGALDAIETGGPAPTPVPSCVVECSGT
jgi:hypothetical protein